MDTDFEPSDEEARAARDEVIRNAVHSLERYNQETEGQPQPHSDEDYFYIHSDVWNAFTFDDKPASTIGVMMWLASKGRVVELHFNELQEATGTHPRKLARMLSKLEEHGQIMIDGEGGVRTITVISPHFITDGHYRSIGALNGWKKGAAKWRGRSIPNSLRAKVFNRDGYVCRYCKTETGPFHIDHVRPVAKGGKDNLANLAVACAPCNLSKGAKTLKQWKGASQ